MKSILINVQAVNSTHLHGRHVDHLKGIFVDGSILSPAEGKKGEDGWQFQNLPAQLRAPSHLGCKLAKLSLAKPSQAKLRLVRLVSLMLAWTWSGH